MHQTQWGPERPLPPPVSLASQSHHEKPPEVTCTSRGNPGFPASTRESPRENFFNTSRGQIPLPWLGSNDLLCFTANPEDYTARGKIIIPLKDRIGSEIATHYPESVELGMAITKQEAWTERGGLPVRV